MSTGKIQCDTSLTRIPGYTHHEQLHSFMRRNLRCWLVFSDVRLWGLLLILCQNPIGRYNARHVVHEFIQVRLVMIIFVLGWGRVSSLGSIQPRMWRGAADDTARTVAYLRSPTGLRSEWILILNFLESLPTSILTIWLLPTICSGLVSTSQKRNYQVFLATLAVE